MYAYAGATGYVNKELVTKHLPPASLGEKAKIFVCGMYTIARTSRPVLTAVVGPPGQVAAIAGKKEGMKQGALAGVLKEVGYTEDQVFKF